MKRSLMALFAALTLAAPRAQAAAMKSEQLACKKENDAAAAAMTRAKNDAKAMATFETQKINSGACIKLARNTIVDIDLREPSLLCVRLTGDLDCYWTAISAVDEFPANAGKGSSGGGAGRSGGHRKH